MHVIAEWELELARECCSTYRFSCRDELGDPALLQHRSDDTRHLRPSLVDEEFGIDKSIGAALRDDFEAARREDVLHPIRAAPVCEREDVSVAPSEEVDRGPIRPDLRPLWMTTPKPGTRRGGRRPGSTQTKAAILAAARDCFAEHGYTETTIRRIATEAEVDPALVMHFLGSKDRLFAETFQLYLTGLLAASTARSLLT